MTSEMSQAMAAGMSPEKGAATATRELSQEDKQLEAALREHVTYPTADQFMEDEDSDLEKNLRNGTVGTSICTLPIHKRRTAL